MSNQYYLDGPLLWTDRGAFQANCNSALERNAILYVDVMPRNYMVASDNLTDAELEIIKSVNKRFDILDSWESSKLRNLTLTQLNTEITTRQNAINACTTLAQAKIELLNLLTDEAKAWRIILWLLKREMNQI
jgi:hypothetical protein